MVGTVMTVWLTSDMKNIFALITVKASFQKATETTLMGINFLAASSGVFAG
jgi:hypothetical protein